ncbi:MAG: hypothetical protein KJ944_00045, partial [Alphaproteobacteria bacterium]|nr:hypothetical protein [Alphaproteobacteria bacterium]MBU2368415.1 hypothetical protein [Alphaproteobacteria bacterium]
AFRNRLGIAVALRNGGLLAVGRPGHYVSEPPRHPSQPTEMMGRGMLGGATPRFVGTLFIEQTGIGPLASGTVVNSWFVLFMFSFAAESWHDVGNDKLTALSDELSPAHRPGRR